MVTSPWKGMAMGLHSHTPDDECDNTCTFYPAVTAPEPEVWYSPAQFDLLNQCRVQQGLEPIEGIRIYPEDIEQETTMYELRVSNAGQEERVLGTYASYEAARDAAVPDHPEEWMWLDDHGYWYHGGGNEPGQSFTITPGPANIVPREPASSADR